MPPIKIGNTELGRLPRIAAVIDRPMEPSALMRLSDLGVTLVELRFDLIGLEARSAAGFAKQVKGLGKFGVIGTLRETLQNTLARFAFFKTVLPVIDCVDIEISSDINARVIQAARGKTVIVSHHDFEKTPEVPELRAMMEKAFDLGAHIFKIAAQAGAKEDVERLMEFAQKCGRPVVAIPMGPLGEDARVGGFTAGSLFTYAFTGDKPVAPGQLSVKEVSARLCKLFTDFKQTHRLK
jgi:3-dehydroquinate dehydratase-1